MATPKYKADTAIVLVDPYNDFLHPEGKATPRLTDLQEKDTVNYLKELVSAAREHGIPVYYALHQQCDSNTFRGWKHMNSSNRRQQQVQFFAQGSFGAEILEGLEPNFENGDVLVSRHWNSNSFHNTDLDFQLRQRDVRNIVFAGLIANTCLEASARHAYELGYNVTMIKDATASFSRELTDAATEMIWKLFANHVLSVAEWKSKLDE